jgi:polyisoprenoid-binding protein YceI
MFMRSIPLALALLLISLQAHAAPPPTWTVNPAKSALTFQVKVNGETVNGTFEGFGALIKFDPANLAQSSAKVIIDTTGIKTKRADRDTMLRQPAWFNILDFPQAVFQTTSIVAKGPNAYEAKAKLTMKGNTQIITLPFKMTITGRTAVMKGETTLRRLAFKIGEGPDYVSDSPVALTVKVMVNVTATRAK